MPTSNKEDVSRRKKYAAPALEKGLDILELLAGEADGLSIKEIASRLDRSVGEIFRMLVVLEQRDYVSSPPNGDRYILTLRMFGLAHRFPPVKRLTTIAGPILRHLAFDIEQSCHLVIYYEGKGRVVVQQDSPSERMFSVRIGAEAPLLNTCSGHLLLSFADDDQRRRMLQRAPDYNSAKNHALDKIIKRVRDHGYENIKSKQTQGVQDIGCPIFDYTGQVIAALVVPFLSYLDGSHLVEADKARELLQAAASDLSSKLGYLS